VGNLSVGGSGKTPVVALVATLLQAEGHGVAVLSRGYGGTFRGECLVVSDGQAILATAREAGDEPVMLSRALPGVVVAVGPRRDVVGRAVERRFGPRVHVLDDGFQHLRLARALDIVCLDASDLSDRPLPAGRLREHPRAAARAGVLLVGGLAGADDSRYATAQELLGPGRTFRLGREAAGFVSPTGESAAAPARPFLLAAIARPERFRHDVQAAVGLVVGDAFYRDHHAFSPTDLTRVSAQAQSAGADAIVTTAKDIERVDAKGLRLPLVVFRTRAVVDDVARLRTLLLEAVGRAA
jgi:tetraacyldisaccharide 4'-kinase